MAIDPVDATARAHLGDLLASAGQWADAAVQYREAIRLVAHPDLYNSLGTVLAQQGRLNEAVTAFREALKIDPSHADARANLEMALEMGADPTPPQKAIGDRRRSAGD